MRSALWVVLLGVSLGCVPAEMDCPDLEFPEELRGREGSWLLVLVTKQRFQAHRDSCGDAAPRERHWVIDSTDELERRFFDLRLPRCGNWGVSVFPVFARSTVDDSLNRTCEQVIDMRQGYWKLDHCQLNRETQPFLPRCLNTFEVVLF